MRRSRGSCFSRGFAVHRVPRLSSNRFQFLPGVSGGIPSVWLTIPGSQVRALPGSSCWRLGCLQREVVLAVDVASGTTRDLPVNEDGVGPRWSPDGQRILYWNEIQGQRDLWTIPVEGGSPVALTLDVHTDWEPLWAEDGRAVYFHSDRGGGIDLWRLPVDPGSGEPAGKPTPLTIGVTPAWESSISADGSRLVVAMRSNGASLRAYPFDPERFTVGEPETLLESNVKILQAHLSPDGSTIYVLEQDVDGEIWMLTLNRP